MSSLHLRPMRDDDQAFLYRLYAATRAQEMALMECDETTRALFMRMQFNAQHAHYRAQFPQADFLIVEDAGKPIGRLYVDRSATAFRLIDISILPEHSNRGIGTVLLQQLLQQAADAAIPLKLQVVQGNRAINLYRRLGLAELGLEGIHITMERSPQIEKWNSVLSQHE